MKKKLLLLSLVTLFAMPAVTFAGGIVTNTNQHAAFIRNPARDASLSIDGVYYNPAGIAFLKQGFHISLNNQTVLQQRNIETTFPLFTYYQGDDTKKFKGDVLAPVVPSLYAAYVADKWSVSLGFGVTGGGGKCDFDEGLPLFDALVMAGLYGRAGVTPNLYTINTSFVGKQYIFGLQLGATYKVLPQLSLFGGVRANYDMMSYDGYLTANLKGVGTQLVDMRLKMDQTGLSFAPVLGIDYHSGKWNLAAKYEFRNKMTVKNDTKNNTTGLTAYDDGVKSRSDIPALLTVGASYDLLSNLRIMGGFHYYFDKDAQLAGDKQQTLSGNTREYLVGFEARLCKWLTLSNGWQVTRYGITDDYISELGFTNDSYSIGVGGAIHFTDDLTLNMGYFFTLYDAYTEKLANYNSTTLPGTNVYTRENQVISIGVDYHF